MFTIECSPDGRGTMVSPDDLISEISISKDLIQKDPGIGIGMPVQVQVQRSHWRQQAVH